MRTMIVAVTLFICFIYAIHGTGPWRLLVSIGLSEEVNRNPKCGKICSYEYDSKTDTEFYPELRKRVNCSDIIYRIAHPQNTVIRPPPRHPPSSLVDNYTQNGQCPIRYHHFYFDNSNNTTLRSYTSKRFDELLAKEKTSVINSYGGDNTLNATLNKYIDSIRGKHVLVIGTVNPWAEAMLINRQATKVTISEYNALKVEHPRIEILTPSKLADRMLQQMSGPQLFDAAFSYSSIEHSGIGRFGDPIDPFGDLEAVAQVWCMVKPGGIFFLALPVSKGRKDCWYEWNAHRTYGNARLQHVTANWKVLEEVNPDGMHWLFVLKKLDQ